MAQRIEFEGKVHEFPDDATQEEISAALSGAATAAPAVDPSLPVPPSGPIETTEPTLFERVTGRRVEDLKQDVSRIADMFGRNFRVGAQGVGRGVANLAGLPGDLAVGAGNLALAGADKVAGWFDGSVDSRFGPSMVGSDAIADTASDAMRSIGVDPIEKEQMNPLGRMFYNVNQYGTEALLGGAALSRLSQAETATDMAMRAPRLGDTLTNPYRVNNARALANDVAAGAGAGVGKTAAEDYLPESVQGPIADLVSMLLGSMGGAAVASGGRTVKEGAKSVADRFIPEKIPYGDDLKPTSRLVARRAAEIMQGANRDAYAPKIGASNPRLAADNIKERAAEAAREGEPMPTAGIATDDIGLNALEKGMRLNDPVRYAENDQRLRDAAQARVTGLRDDNADPRAAQRFVEGEVQAQRDAAQAPVDAARKDKSATQDANTQALNAAELKRAEDLAAREADVSRRERELRLAQESESAAAVRVQSNRENEGPASERLAGAVGAAKQADEATKGTLYREAETLGKETSVDPTPFIESAKAVRGDISRLAGQDPKLANILDDLDRLAPETGSPAPIAASDLIAMRPRLSAARDSAHKAYRGPTVKAIDEINSGIKAELDRLAESGDAAALKWREAEGNFKENFAPKYREGVGGQLDRAERGNNPTPPTAVASKFLKPGAGGKEAAEDLNRILSGAASEADGKAAARDYVLADMAKVVRDGKINPEALRTWIANRKGVLDTMPELRAEAEQTLRDVMSKKAATTEMQKSLEQTILDRKNAEVKWRKDINEIKANNKLTEKQKQDKIDELDRQRAQVERDIQRSATSLLIDTAPEKAAASVFGARDPQTAMREIVAKVAKDPQAAAGWKRAVVDYLIGRVTNTNTALAKGETDGPLSLANLQKMFKENEKTLAEAFSPAEMHALRRAHKMLEPLGNLSRQATAGSATTENKMLWNTLEAGLLAVTGNAITTGMVMKRIRVATNFLPTEMEAVKQLVSRAMFDPELAQHLLTRDVKKIESPEWNRNLARLIAAGQASADDAEEN